MRRPEIYRHLIPLAIVAVTLAAFWPALHNGFLDWDDTTNFVDNPHYRGLGWGNLKWMFTTSFSGLYIPLTWVTLGLDYCVWGLNPLGYHLTNLLLHGANAVALYFLALRLYARPGLRPEPAAAWAAAAAALLFAIHPLRAESVAWVTERRDVLSGFFFILSVLAYVRSARAAALLLFFCSLLSKASGVFLPVLLIILDIYPLRRLPAARGWFTPESRRVWLEKLPFFALSVAAGAAAAYGQMHTGAAISLSSLSVAQRLALAAHSAAFYLQKTLLPFGLSPFYFLPPEISLLKFPFLPEWILLALLSAAFWRLRKSWPLGLTVWLSYLGLLLPVSGLAQSGHQFAADRYTYLPCLGWAVLGGAWLLMEARQPREWRRRAAALTMLLVLGGFAALTRTQVRAWRDDESFLAQILRVEPRSPFAHNNIGVRLARRGRLKEAIVHFSLALETAPKYIVARQNLEYAQTILRARL